MDSSRLTLKLNFKGDIRRFKIKTDDVSFSFDNLCKVAKEKYGEELQRFSSLKFSYIDEEKDIVSVTRDEELQEALKQSRKQGDGVLKIKVEEGKEKRADRINLEPFPLQKESTTSIQSNFLFEKRVDVLSETQEAFYNQATNSEVEGVEKQEQIEANNPLKPLTLNNEQVREKFFCSAQSEKIAEEVKSSSSTLANNVDKIGTLQTELCSLYSKTVSAFNSDLSVDFFSDETVANVKEIATQVKDLVIEETRQFFHTLQNL